MLLSGSVREACNVAPIFLVTIEHGYRLRHAFYSSFLSSLEESVFVRASCDLFGCPS